jgi:hypothetical protein
MAGLAWVWVSAATLSCASGSADSPAPRDATSSDDSSSAEAGSDDAPGDSAFDATAPANDSGAEAASGDASGDGEDDVAGDGSAATDSAAAETGGMDSGPTFDTGAPDGGSAADAGIMPGTYYTLTNLATSFVVDVRGASTSSGAMVIQYATNGGYNQDWSFLAAVGGGFVVLNRNSLMALDVSGTLVDQASPSGTTKQQWILSPASTPGFYTFTSASGAGLLTSPSSTQGDQLVVATANGTTSQEWQLAVAP